MNAKEHIAKLIEQGGDHLADKLRLELFTGCEVCGRQLMDGEELSGDTKVVAMDTKDQVHVVCSTCATSRPLMRKLFGVKFTCNYTKEQLEEKLAEVEKYLAEYAPCIKELDVLLDLLVFNPDEHDSLRRVVVASSMSPFHVLQQDRRTIIKEALRRLEEEQ